jgi:Kef-type K+ transport system membrane component KefB
MAASVSPVAPIGPHELLIFLLQVGMLLALAKLLGRLAMRFGMPTVVGELCAGVLLGPSLLEYLAPGLSAWLLPKQPGQFHLLDAVGQVGVLLLVGITGTHLDTGLMRRQGTTAACVSGAGLVVPLGLGIGCAYLLPSSLLSGGTDRSVFALFLGVAMCVSAVPVIAKTLMDMDLIHRNVGQLTLTAAMVDDAVGWLLLSVVSALATTGLSGQHVALSALYLCGLIAAAISVGRPVVRTILRLNGGLDEPGTAAGVTVAMLLLSAAATHALGLEAVLGAFIAGTLIGSCGLDLARLAPLRVFVLSVLAPVFFATAGLRMDLTALRQPVVFAAAVVVLLIAVVGKFAGAYIGARLSRLSRWEAIALGAGMNARGVIEVIIAMVGLRLGVLSTETYTIIVLVAIVTSLMAPPILRFALRRVEPTAAERARAIRYGPVRLETS